MKKHASNNTPVTGNKALRDNASRVILIAAIVLYTVSLFLLANIALANSSSKGALIKVNNQLDAQAFDNLQLDVKSFAGNILSVDVPTQSIAKLNSVTGLCASKLDHSPSDQAELDASSIRKVYAGVGAVIGILDNTSDVGASAISSMQKVEAKSNIGFVSYLSNDPNSTVIMHSLKGGESNLVQALIYMQEYAKTVNKPLVVEMNIDNAALNNPLFVQACQKFAEAGIQFIGESAGQIQSDNNVPVQLAFSMFDAETGVITDQSDFWAIEEVKQQQIMMLGSDERMCNVHFQTESGFDKVYLSNGSTDLVMVTAITADGSVNYYHITRKETALIPRALMNGTPILEDGLGGVYPYYAKGILFNGAVASQQFVSLTGTEQQVRVNDKNGMALKVGSPSSKTLSMNMENITTGLEIEIKDETGATVYRSNPNDDTQSISTRIDLSNSVGGLYFLDLTSPDFHQTFALKMD